MREKRSERAVGVGSERKETGGCVTHTRTQADADREAAGTRNRGSGVRRRKECDDRKAKIRHDSPV